MYKLVTLNSHFKFKLVVKSRIKLAFNFEKELLNYTGKEGYLDIIKIVDIWIILANESPV